MKAIKRFLGTTNKIQLKRFLFLSGLVAIFLISLIFYNLIFSNFFYNCGNGEQCFKRFSDEPHPAASSSLTVAGGIVPFDEQASEITEEFFKNLNIYGEGKYNRLYRTQIFALTGPLKEIKPVIDQLLNK